LHACTSPEVPISQTCAVMRQLDVARERLYDLRRNIVTPNDALIRRVIPGFARALALYSQIVTRIREEPPKKSLVGFSSRSPGVR
jgi:hypothetical protein